MAISISWGTKVINVPKADMTLIQSTPYEIRELDLDVFRLALKDLEDSEEGMAFPDTHIHITESILGGITYVRKIEIINDYTVTFEDGQYGVNAVGANSNLMDVLNPNQVSLRTANSAGLIEVSSGSGLSGEEHDELMSIKTDVVSALEISLDTIDGKIDGMVVNIATILGIDQLLLAFIKNKKYLTKVGNVWYFVIRDSDDLSDILRKELKDVSSLDITDIQPGILAQELKSSV